MPETVAPPAAAITEAPPAVRPKVDAPTRLINVKSQSSPGTSAQLPTRRAQNKLKGVPGRIVRGVQKEVLPQALLSDAVAVLASPNSAVEGCNW
jgi:hypothetical protein